MNDAERQLISGLFQRIRGAETAYRDPEAEDFIQRQVESQPHAPYALAQTVIVQNQSLEAAKARITELEGELEAARSQGEAPGASPWGPRASGQPMGAPSGFGQQSGGGFLGRQGYEGSQPYGAPSYGTPPAQPQAAPSRGGGFLSGALQTAAGVAGGALLFHGLSSLFGGGDEAKAGALGDQANALGGAGGDANPAEQSGGWFSGLLGGDSQPGQPGDDNFDIGSDGIGDADGGDWT